MRILLVEDDPRTVRSIEMILSNANLSIFSTNFGEEAIGLARLYDFDLIVLDLGLPDISGHDVLRKLRGARIKTPVLILSGTQDAESRVRGLTAGADDYLTKPFNRDELVARVHAIVRRSQGHAESQVRVGRLTVKIGSRCAEIDGQPLKLTNKEFQMLELLALRKGTTLTKETFLNQLYGGIDEPDVKIIDVFICKLRKKIAAATGGESYIRTVWGRGFIMQDPARVLAA